MDRRELIALACMLAVSAGMSNMEREVSLADYSPKIREGLASLSNNWADGWQQVLDPGPKPKVKAAIDQVNFLLWTRSNRNVEYVLEAFNADSFAASNFDSSKETLLVFHGYISSGNASWILDAKNALLDRVDANFISVDWGELAAGPDYVDAAAGVYETANLTASLLDWMVDNVGLDFQMTALAGHSLGAQCAGMVGNTVTSGKLDRVTGLDPASQLFEEVDESQRINPNSATFVDIIHTDACSQEDGCAGMIEPVGQVDFYPNGGAHQVGCPLVNSTSIIDHKLCCSHCRSYEYWVESIRAQEPTDKTFWAKPCSDWSTYEAGLCSSCGNGCIQMGYPADISGVIIGAGIEYYLTTNAHAPFAKGLN
ncbi:inactive pancreatic lipase-related protein 1 isoform X3 [Hyalella azteca]|uniref:Inactive pancreatic lipase-related protein 1 isoform X3 n=1 Tax=Hyalella azteca TaxID=294128 RepID=A0A8B7N6A1_HYAAZ|nr:inactive pancreatic lipase-related protein 1 isoform X3 [Hyalella azteca]